MSQQNRFERLDQFLDRSCCPGSSKMLVRRIYQKGHVTMPRHLFENDTDAEALSRNGVIKMEAGEIVTLTSFAESKIDGETRH